MWCSFNTPVNRFVSLDFVTMTARRVVRTAATGQRARIDLSLQDRVNRLEWTVIASAILYSAWILLWRNHSSGTAL